MKPDNIKPDWEGRCPCGGHIAADTRRCAVIHDLPMCEKFRVLEPDAFLRYVRQATTGITDN